MPIITNNNNCSTTEKIEQYSTVEDLFNGELTIIQKQQDTTNSDQTISLESKEKEQKKLLETNKSKKQKNLTYSQDCVKKARLSNYTNSDQATCSHTETNSIITINSDSEQCTEKNNSEYKDKSCETIAKKPRTFTIRKSCRPRKINKAIECGLKSRSFVFPTKDDELHLLISNYSQTTPEDILKILGPELSIGFLKSKELNELVEIAPTILRDHYCGDFLPSTLIFVHNSFINKTDKINVKDINYVVAASKAKNKTMNHKFKDYYTFVTMSTVDTKNTEKFLVVTSPLLNEKGDLRDANINYVFIVQFYDQIEKCKIHSNGYCNCYSIEIAKEKNIISYSQNSRGSYYKYKITNHKSLGDYTQKMKHLMENRIIDCIETIRNQVKKYTSMHKKIF